eukprot:GHVO01053885.1.p1 GENE.GHVO01053885.1~~GHVO01053885.1.p1  ORF type:complete len:384 (+),score=70.38 GHVO01053885.1:23-1153(+)
MNITNRGVLLSFLCFWLIFETGHAAKSNKDQDMYGRLEVSRSATVAEIKKAYRKMSVKYHPDKNPDASAHDKFAQIAEAYEILTDEALRKTYDRDGMAGVKRARERENNGGDHQDPFGDFFGFGSFFGGGGRSQQPPKVAPTHIPLRLTLEQIFFGEIYHVEYNRGVVCANLDDCIKVRNDCEGAGVRSVTQRFNAHQYFTTQQHDDTCVGKRKGWKADCSACPNGIREMKSAPLTVFIPRGIREGEAIKFEEEGPDHPDHTAGDLILDIIEIPHPTFRRNGDNLHYDLVITLLEALVGFEKSIGHVDKNNPVHIHRTDTSRDHQVIVVSGRGLPRTKGDGFGDLHVTVNVKYPSSLSDKQKDHAKLALTDIGTWI